jgi:hypothetical protein
LQNAAALHTRYTTMKRVLIVLTAFSVSLGFACAQTQGLQQLSIAILTMAADHTHVVVGKPFHLTIHAHVTQRITRLDNLTLPGLADFDEVSREAHMTPAAGGTDYDEVLTLKPKHAGEIEIAPVTIDAINTQSMKPSRFSSTEQVVIHAVTDASQSSGPSPEILARDAAIAVISLLVAYLTFRIGGTFFDWTVDSYRRRRTHPKQVPPVMSESYARPPVRMTPVEQFRLAITMVKRDPSASSAETLRLALRAALGATEEETMADIVGRIALEDRSILERALRAAERAAFIDTNLRRSAIEDGLPIFEIACRRLEKECP